MSPSPRGPRSLPVGLLALGLVLGASGPLRAEETGTRGEETGLPVDEEVVGTWLRAGVPGHPAEAVCYRAGGLYDRVTRAGVESGLWTTWVHRDLRWLRRCARSGGRAPDPGDCGYFGRYAVAGDELLEEEICPEAWAPFLDRPPDVESLRRGCAGIASRLGGEMTIGEMQGAVDDLPADPAPRPPPGPTGPAGEGEIQGVWVGAVGAGPGQVTLTFEAREGGVFLYTLEAAGEQESAEGKWQTDGKTLVLEHDSGEVEQIPFRFAEGVLLWTDEDLGELRLDRRGS